MLAVERDVVEEEGIGRKIRRLARDDRHRAADEAGDHEGFELELVDRELRLGDRLGRRVHRNGRRRGQPLLVLGEEVGKHDVERAAGGTAHLLILLADELQPQRRIDDAEIDAELVEAPAQQARQQRGGAVERVFGGAPPPGSARHADVAALGGGEVVPIRADMLRHDALEALEDARPRDLAQILLVGRPVFDDVPVAVDHGMTEPGADLGRALMRLAHLSSLASPPVLSRGWYRLLQLRGSPHLTPTVSAPRGRSNPFDRFAIEPKRGRLQSGRPGCWRDPRSGRVRWGCYGTSTDPLISALAP